MKIDREIRIVVSPREDGGVRVWSDDVPGLILSGLDVRNVLLDISPALVTILEYRTARP